MILRSSGLVEGPSWIKLQHSGGGRGVSAESDLFTLNGPDPSTGYLITETSRPSLRGSSRKRPLRLDLAGPSADTGSFGQPEANPKKNSTTWHLELTRFFSSFLFYYILFKYLINTCANVLSHQEIVV